MILTETKLKILEILKEKGARATVLTGYRTDKVDAEFREKLKSKGIKAKDFEVREALEDLEMNGVIFIHRGVDVAAEITPEGEKWHLRASEKR